MDRKIVNIIVNTGGNLPEVWQRIGWLKRHRYPVIIIGSYNKDHPSYYEYIKKEGLKPFYLSCSDKAKQRHLDAFAKYMEIDICRIGYTKEDAGRVKHFKNIERYEFPLLNLTREEAENKLREYGLEPLPTRTGCWFCPKQPKASKEWLRVTHPDLYQEAKERFW